jgi:hypothetical protein
LGALATTLGFARAGAMHFDCRHVGVHCNRKGQCCSHRCKNNRCRAHSVGGRNAETDICVSGDTLCGKTIHCACNRTTGGAFFCSNASGGICMECSTDVQCAKALGKAGAACVEANYGLCTVCPSEGFATACLEPCTE